MHEYLIENERGEIVDAVPCCSDACHRDLAGDAYGGWNGCNEAEFTTFCASCGVVIPGFEDACDCQLSNVVVNRFRSEDGERCEHGNWLQLPMSMLGDGKEGMMDAEAIHEAGYRVGDVVRAFHPCEFGVVRVGRVVKVGRKYVHVDFGPLLGGTFRVVPRHVVGVEGKGE